MINPRGMYRSKVQLQYWNTFIFHVNVELQLRAGRQMSMRSKFQTLVHYYTITIKKY